MKSLFLSLMFTLSIGYMAGQSSGLNVINTSSCGYNVKATAADTICDSLCFSIVYCLGPSDTLVIPPCSSDTLRMWDNIAISPVRYPDCVPCSSSRTLYLNSATGPQCKEYASASEDNSHCQGCIFSASFVSPNHVLIQ